MLSRCAAFATSFTPRHAAGQPLPRHASDIFSTDHLLYTQHSSLSRMAEGQPEADIFSRPEPGMAVQLKIYSFSFSLHRRAGFRRC